MLGKTSSRIAVPRRPLIQLVAAVLIFLLGAATVIVFLELRHAGHPYVPAALDMKAYQALVNRDDTQLSAAYNDSCSTLQSTCPAPGHPFLTALQRWLDDLNASEPPSRFAVIDAQLRLHLAANISDVNAVFDAHRAQDQDALDRASFAGNIEAEWLHALAASIVRSQQGTVAVYDAAVQAAQQNLIANPILLALGGAGQVACLGSASCQGDVFDARSSVQDFEAAIVRIAAPSSLAAQDALLQRDLAQADSGLTAMANADLSGGQPAFNSGRAALQRALPAVEADIVGILGS
jgi:hypothetical protein